MRHFDESEDLLIGHVVEVSGTSVRVEIDSGLPDLNRVVNGRVCPVGQLGSIVKIHYGRRILFAYVRLLRMRSEIAAELGQGAVSQSDDSRVLEADLFAEGTWHAAPVGNLEFHRGVETYPLPLQKVYLTTPDEMEEIFSAAESTAQKTAISPLVPFAEYVGGNGAICRANIDKLFGQHCAVLGSTGSGKSGAVAAILRSVVEHSPANEKPLQPRIVLIDPHGEYASAFKQESIVLKAYAASAGDADGTSVRLRLPSGSCLAMRLGVSSSAKQSMRLRLRTTLFTRH
jgi:hypothetical protein